MGRPFFSSEVFSSNLACAAGVMAGILSAFMPCAPTPPYQTPERSWVGMGGVFRGALPELCITAALPADCVTCALPELCATAALFCVTAALPAANVEGAWP